MKGQSNKDQNSQTTSINKFEGYYSFLSNDFATWVCYEGILFPSLNIAFQAARTDDILIRQKLSALSDVQEFKNIATSIKNPEDWGERKSKVMQMLVRDKFKRNKDLQAKLIGTKDKKLINTMKKTGYNELYWGVFEGQGTNMLGKILMAIRDQFNKGTDTKKWIQQNLGLEKDQNLFAKVEMLVTKDERKIDRLFLDKNKNYYLFGSLKTSDFHLENPTISRTHACICFCSDLEVVLIDLNSTHGTFLKEKDSNELIRMEPLISYKLDKGDAIQFGTSTRQYHIEVDRALVEQYIEQNQKVLKNELDDSIRKLAGRKVEELDSDQVKKSLGFENKCILVEDIKEEVSYHQLKDEFSKFGKVLKLRMQVDRKTGKFLGKAVVYYQSNEIVRNILANSKSIGYRLRGVTEEAGEQIIIGKDRKQAREARDREKDQKRDSFTNQKRDRDRSRSRQKKSKKK